MRQLSHPPSPRLLPSWKNCAGFTLIELVVVMVIVGIAMSQAVPAMAGYITNSQLRESANVLASAGLTARSEAIKRNTPVQVLTSARTITVQDLSDPNAPVVIKTIELTDKATLSSAQFTFASTGLLTPFGSSAWVGVTSTKAACDANVACPAVIVQAGGAITLCKDNCNAQSK